MPSKRTRWWITAIWTCFLLRGWFYAAMFPLWEGYDEFAHVGVVRAMAFQGRWLLPLDQPGQRDVQESMLLVPVPWQWRGWDVFRSSLTEEDYWALPPQERQQRESRLRSMPLDWASQDSTAGVSAYEAAQPPLYYWLMAPALYLLRGCSLLTQVMALRWIGVALASVAVPLTFAVARKVVRSEAAALGCAAVAAVMPGFAINVARVSNEPLAIVLFTLLIWLGLRVLDRAPNPRDALALGVLLGLGLLTKAYFLAAIPPVLLLMFYKYRKAWPHAWTATAATIAIAGWWYFRNVLITGTISAQPEAVALRNRGLAASLSAILHITWLRAIDVILVSHLYYCGWSALGVRSWMYHVFFAIAAVAALALIAQLRRPAVLWLAAIYGFFWLAQMYNVFLQSMVKGLAGSMGWYLYAVVASEVVLCVAAFARWRVWAAAAGTCLFGFLDLYGMHWLAIPYYTGIIGHRPNGSLAALHVAAYRTIGFNGAFERLAANKPAAMTPPAFIVLWSLYLAATIVLMAIAFLRAARRRSHAE